MQHILTFSSGPRIVKDFGIYDSPDEFYGENGENLTGVKSILFKYVVRRLMNRNIRRIRTNADSGT